MEPIKVAIFVPDEEAKLFIEFQKYYPIFRLLEEKGVFNQKNCAITLHFDNLGELRTIQRADVLYSARHE